MNPIERGLGAHSIAPEAASWPTSSQVQACLLGATGALLCQCVPGGFDPGVETLKRQHGSWNVLGAVLDSDIERLPIWVLANLNTYVIHIKERTLSAGTIARRRPLLPQGGHVRKVDLRWRHALLMTARPESSNADYCKQAPMQRSATTSSHGSDHTGVFAPRSVRACGVVVIPRCRISLMRLQAWLGTCCRLPRCG